MKSPEDMWLKRRAKSGKFDPEFMKMLNTVKVASFSSWYAECPQCGCKWGPFTEGQTDSLDLIVRTHAFLFDHKPVMTITRQKTMQRIKG